MDVSAAALQRAHRPHREIRVVRVEDRRPVRHLELVRLATVVEPRRALDLEAHLPAYHPENANQPVMGGLDLRVLDGHEVENLPDTAGGHEACDQDRRVREVELSAQAALVAR